MQYQPRPSARKSKPGLLAYSRISLHPREPKPDEHWLIGVTEKSTAASSLLHGLMMRQAP